ncbi:carbohydrate kinase family protein [Actinoallomurus iriomotensis]|uniref:Fructokinase n=1 Tax=Actinoallomurus iriomotensis TaxID=478107 RepID=A0A9W6SEA7_9ACTN|nr:carbohydrate kinase [Actinoallomurus iriomotensis]GLY92009.1 fructokinase [Actinoallomurus iriomotensis]
MTRQPPAILVIGESVMDVIADPAGKRSVTPGGSSLNVAVALGRLKVPVQFMTALGSDGHGEQILAHLHDAGAEVVSAGPAGAGTPVATAKLAADGSADYDLDFTWNLRADVPITEVGLLHAGSLALFLEPGAGRVREILATARRRGAVVSIDPNIRPSLLPPRQEVRRLFEGLCAHADIVKLSDEDASWLYPGLTPGELVGMLLGLGVSLVGLTAGADGSLLASGGHRVQIPSVPARVVDTIGAGDAYMSGLLYKIIELDLANTLRRPGGLPGDTLRTIGTFAALTAGVTVTRRGADPPRLSQLGPEVPHPGRPPSMAQETR